MPRKADGRCVEFEFYLGDWETRRLGDSEDVPRQILIPHDIRQHARHILRVNSDFTSVHVTCVEGQLIDEALEDRVQAARADVLRFLVH